MKVSLSPNVLQVALRTVSSAVSRRATLPILSNVLLEAGPEKLRVVTSNLEMAITTWIPLEGHIAPGSYTVPHRLLSRLLCRLTSRLHRQRGF